MWKTSVSVWRTITQKRAPIDLVGTLHSYYESRQLRTTSTSTPTQALWMLYYWGPRCPGIGQMSLHICHPLQVLAIQHFRTPKTFPLVLAERSWIASGPSCLRLPSRLTITCQPVIGPR